MRKPKLLILSLLMAMSLLCSITASAYDFEAGGIYYTITSTTDKTVEVTFKDNSYNSYSGAVTIPASVAYSGATYAVTSIGGGAFNDCTGLTSVKIPASVISIDYYAFYYCTGLKEFVVDANNAKYVAIDSVLFSKDKTILVAYPYAKGATYEIPAGTTLIGNNAFRLCKGLTKVTIPASVTSIGGYAFDGCAGLTSVAIPDGVTSIGRNAFAGCMGLTGVTIPNSVTSFGYNAFCMCYGLESVTICDGVTSIGNSAFWCCKGLTNLVLGKGVKSIGNHAFEGCTGLTSVTIPDSTTKIDLYAFGSCSGLTKVNIGKSVASIHDVEFYDCAGLKEFIVDENNAKYTAVDGVLFSKDKTTLIAYPNAKGAAYSIPACTDLIGSEAFSGCKGLTNVTIPASVTLIGESAFSGCTGLTSVSIPDSVTRVGGLAFNGTAWLNNQPDGMVYVGLDAYRYKGTMPTGTQITIKDGTKSISDGAFDECVGLSGITIPNSVTFVGFAFLDCTGLTSMHFNAIACDIMGSAYGCVLSKCTVLSSLIIGGNVAKIPSHAFTDCKALKEIYNCNPKPPKISITQFYFVDKAACTLYVPTGCTAAYQAATGWKDFTNIKEFDAAGVATVGSDAVKVTVRAGEITIEGTDAPARVYGIGGQLIYAGSARVIAVPSAGMYIVTVGGKGYKVRL